MMHGELTLHDIVSVALTQDQRLDAPLELRCSTKDGRVIEISIYAPKEQRVQLLLGSE